MSKNTNKAIIHHIGLKNFKGYQEASIPLAPITLLFGPNSAGKSTVFQVLYLLKQTLQFAPQDVPLLFRCDNGYVDLGSFEDVVFDHDKSRLLGISLNGMEWTYCLENNNIFIDRITLPETKTKWAWELSAKEKSSIVRKNGKLVCVTQSPFFNDIYKYILDNRESILWGIEQQCIIDAMDVALNMDKFSNERHQVGMRVFFLNECYAKYKIDGEWQDYHLGEGFDLRELWSKDKLEIDYRKRIQRQYKPGDLNEPYSEAALMRGALDLCSMECDEAKSHMGELKAWLTDILKTEEYVAELSNTRSKVIHIIELLKTEFTSEKLWDLLNVRTDGLEVQIDKFLPVAYEDTHQLERPITDLIQYMTIISPTIGIFQEYSELISEGHVGPGFKVATGLPVEGSPIAVAPRCAFNYQDKILVSNAMCQVQFNNAKYAPVGEEGWLKTWHDTVGNSTRGCERLLYWLETNTIQKTLNEVTKPIGAIRQAPRRLYWSSKSVAGNVGFMGEWVGDVLLDEGCKAEVNKWLIRLTGYEVEREDVGSILPGAYVLKVRDTRRKGAQYVKITDVGFGISQVLPLAAQLVASKESIITVEQPESQIHPALQADFAELVVWSMKERKNQVLIETHSEHLALRIQALIHKGDVLPNDVSVVYVQRNEKGSSIQQLQLDEQGRFKDAWPGGFFPERRKDMLALLEDKDEQ